MKLKGKVAIITGASRGIGRGIAEVFAEEGADVRGQLRCRSEGTPRRSRLGSATEAVAQLRSKLTWPTAVKFEAMFEQVWKELGPVDILVNNAGIETIVPFLELTTSSGPGSWT
jgi:glucose 1-dehydrogenase/3-oxoacyl-[acyl-carrier protein] reductase